jgi:phage shock protein PspC (stress-responsive transcriptional regulator)
MTTQRKKKPNAPSSANISKFKGTKKMSKPFKLDTANAKLMGVCSGIANWANIDVSIVRILWVLAVLFGVGAPVIIYLLIGLIAD